jgi:GT2 family glycosyltransferase
VNEPLVSIIIAVHNGMDHIDKCLSSLFSQTYLAFEVVVVDNDSTDGTADHVQKSYPSVRLIRSPVNLAYGKGNNLGALGAKGEFLLFVNHDVTVTRNFLCELVNVMQADPMVGVAQSKIMMASNPELIDSVGAYLTSTGVWVHPKHGEPDDLGNGEPVEILGACGACLMVRSDLFRALGGFDPEFLIYYDDADLAWRARLCGARAVVVPASVVIHWGGATTRHMPSSFTVYHSFKNRLCSLIKLMSGRDLIVALPAQTALGFAGALAYFLRGKPSNGLAIVRSFLWNLMSLRSTLQKRTVAGAKLVKRRREVYRDLMVKFPLTYFLRTSLAYVSKW